MSVGKMIQQVIKSKNISQTELASRVSIPVSTMNGYILERFEPDYEKLKTISNVLGVSVNYLLEIESDNMFNEHEVSLVLQYREYNEAKRKMLLDYMAFLNT